MIRLNATVVKDKKRGWVLEVRGAYEDVADLRRALDEHPFRVECYGTDDLCDSGFAVIVPRRKYDWEKRKAKKAEKCGKLRVRPCTCCNKAFDAEDAVCPYCGCARPGMMVGERP